jgi:hypothetical protein
MSEKIQPESAAEGAESDVADVEESAERKAMPLRCRWGYHLWSVWGGIKLKHALPGKARYQKSECLKCGALRERYITD